MIVSIVNGSPRSDGATAKVLKAAGVYLAQKPEVEVRYLDLGRESFEFCQGCQRCYRTGRCAIQRDRLELAADTVKGSHGIIMGSPTYGSNITAQLKNFLDRGHFILEQSLRGRYGLSVSTYEIADGRQVNRVLNKFFLVAGAVRCGSVSIKTDFNADPMASPVHGRRLERQLDRFYRAIERRARRSLFEWLFTDHLLVRLIWKPFFLKRRDKYAGVLEQWRTRKLYAGGPVR